MPITDQFPLAAGFLEGIDMLGVCADPDEVFLRSGFRTGVLEVITIVDEILSLFLGVVIVLQVVRIGCRYTFVHDTETCVLLCEVVAACTVAVCYDLVSGMYSELYEIRRFS